MASIAPPYRQHLTSSKNLVTTYEEIRAGFVALALEKNRRATPMVEEARALQAMASKSQTAAGLVRIDGIEPALLSAAGVSDKAAELVFRFLLTRGDALGGSMRNVGGVLAQRKFTRCVIATLSVAAIPYRWLHSSSNTWISMTKDDADIELNLKGLSWSSDRRTRTILYNRTPPFVKRNVDLCLLNCEPSDAKSALRTPPLYVALGELKGGIDPAGADEHWKTAQSALKGIRDAFSKVDLSPRTFFVGAAIAPQMATEIWSQLEDGTLSNAANLTGSNQVTSLCQWLCSL